MLHLVLANAAAGDPYSIDTLILFMANMAWNSSMDTPGAQAHLTAKDASGEYRIPFVVAVDAFHSETVNFADLVLPDTTYLERYDAISLLDRPISEIDTAADAIRHPVVPLDRDVRPWQEVLVDLAGRLEFPAFTLPDGSRKFSGYQDFIVRYERAPGIGFLAGWRGENGEKSLRGAPNPEQWQRYIDNQSFFSHHWADHEKYYRCANAAYQARAIEAGFIAKSEPMIMQIYVEPLQKFRLAGLGLYNGPRPTQAEDAARLVRYFDPLPDWYPPLEGAAIDAKEFPLHAITQRPMVMYHSWDSQNVWLRQLLAQNALYMNTKTAARLGLTDGDRVRVRSHLREIECGLKTMEAVEPNTVWTWNAVAKQPGAWGLDATASESTDGFLLNQLIAEHLPQAATARAGAARYGNADPITGQAAWFDLRVSVKKK